MLARRLRRQEEDKISTPSGVEEQGKRIIKNEETERQG
jgi:hypothetical protein